MDLEIIVLRMEREILSITKTFYFFLLWIIERGVGRERERERKIDVREKH